MKRRCKYGKLKKRIGNRICRRKPKARSRPKAKKRKKSPLTKWFIRGNRAKGTKRKYLTQRQLDTFRAKRAREVQARRDARRGKRRQQRVAPQAQRSSSSAPGHTGPWFLMKPGMAGYRRRR